MKGVNMEQMEIDKQLNFLKYQNEQLDEAMNFVAEASLQLDHPRKMRQFYNYKVESQADYGEQMIDVKQDYKSGIVDPSRYVARMEIRKDKATK